MPYMCCKVIKKFFQRWTFWLTCVDCIHIPSSADDCRWTGGVVCSRSLALLLLLLVVNGVALLLLWCCSINGTTTTTTWRWWTRFRSWGFARYISTSTVISNLFFSNLAIPNWHCTIFLHFRVCTDIFRKWVQIDEKNHLSNLYFWRKEN